MTTHRHHIIGGRNYAVTIRNIKRQLARGYRRACKKAIDNGDDIPRAVKDNRAFY